MGAVTKGGLPYPLGTDLVVDGDNAIRALAEAIDPAVAIAPGLTMPRIAASAAARDAYWGVPTVPADQVKLQNRGAQTVRTDTGWTEQYFAASANGGPVAVAGWFPISGAVPNFRMGKNSTTMQPSSGVFFQITDTFFTVDQQKAVNYFTGADTRIEITQRGRYTLFGQLGYTASATSAGSRLFLVNRNSTTLTTNMLIQSSIPGSSLSNAAAGGTTEVVLAAGDVLRVWSYQSSGGLLAMVNGADFTFMGVTYRGPA